MQEFFDVLDETGVYIGKTETREKCHSNGLWHKAVVVFVINSNKQILLQKRSATKKLWPNMWDVSAGGHVLSGEFGFQSAIREAKEELNLNLDKQDLTFIGATTSVNTKGDIINKHFNEYYIAKMDIDINALKLQTEEVSEVKWIDKEEILERIKNNYDGITDKQGCWEYLAEFYKWLDTNK